MSDLYPKVAPYVVTQQPVEVQVQMPHANPFLGMHNEWHSSMFDCCDNGSTCCYAYLCWCCFVGSLANSIGESQCSCWCVPYSLAMYRMKVRSVLHIRGDTCSDHSAATFCAFCTGIQMRNELDFHGID